MPDSLRNVLEFYFLLFYFHRFVSFCRVCRIGAHRLFILIKLPTSSESQAYACRFFSDSISISGNLLSLFEHSFRYLTPLDVRDSLINFHHRILFRFTLPRPPLRMLQVLSLWWHLIWLVWHLSKIYFDKSQQAERTVGFLICWQPRENCRAQIA